MWPIITIQLISLLLINDSDKVGTVFFQLIAEPQIVTALGWSSHSARLKTINLYFIDIKILVSRRTYFYLKFIVAVAIKCGM